MLKKLDAIAGIPKTFRALSIPMASAASETMRMKGNIRRVSSVVSAFFSGENPQLSPSTNRGAARIPSTVTALRLTAASVATRRANPHADSSPSA